MRENRDHPFDQRRVDIESHSTLILKLSMNLIINNNRMSESLDYRAAYLHLRNQNQILKAELDEARQRETSLKRQIEIMSQIQQQQSKNPHPLHQIHQEQLSQLKQQLISLIGEKEQIEALNRTYLQKINDLKYNNGELKNLNQKLNQLHARQLEMIKRQSVYPEKTRQFQEKERALTRDKEILSKQLQEVAKVAEQMEIYYVCQIRKKNQQLKSKEEEISCLKRDLEGTRTQRLQQGDQNRISNEKWQRHILSLKQQHQAQVAELRSKITFLINKIENQEQKCSKPSLGGVSVIGAQLVQSKMLQSNSSVDSFRIAQSGSFSGKEYPTRRNTSGSAKTPTKYLAGKMGKSTCPLGERNL